MRISDRRSHDEDTRDPADLNYRSHARPVHPLRLMRRLFPVLNLAPADICTPGDGWIPTLRRAPRRQPGLAERRRRVDDDGGRGYPHLTYRSQLFTIPASRRVDDGGRGYPHLTYSWKKNWKGF